MGTTTLRVVGNGEKKIVGSNTQKVSEEDLLKAENQLRSEAQTLVREISHKYWDLGRVLYDVYDGVPGGYRGLMIGDGSKQNRTSLFEKWGYKNFGEYCEQEVGLQKRTAENLRFAYYYFAVQQEMPESVIDELVSIGRSKVYLLSGVANRDSIALWLEKAKELTFEELKKAIKSAKAVSAGRNVDDEEGEMPDDAAAPSARPASAATSPVLQKPEELHTRQFGMYDSQLETWDAAMDRAQGLTGSEKIGHNLELICQDFLANNDFSKIKDKDRSAYLAKMERRLGVLIIAVDPNSGKPIHGRDLLWRMIKESKAEE